MPACGLVWRAQQHSLGLAVSHSHFEYYVAVEFFMAMLDVSLDFALQAITIDGLWLGRMLVAAVGDGAAVYVTGFYRHIIKSAMATKLSC